MWPLWVALGTALLVLLVGSGLLVRSLRAAGLSMTGDDSTTATAAAKAEEEPGPWEDSEIVVAMYKEPTAWLHKMSPAMRARTRLFLKSRDHGDLPPSDTFLEVR